MSRKVLKVAYSADHYLFKPYAFKSHYRIAEMDPTSPVVFPSVHFLYFVLLIAIFVVFGVNQHCTISDYYLATTNTPSVRL